MDRLALIFCAGGLGALTRYEVQGYVNGLIGRPTVLGTLAVNASGAFLLGLLMAFTEERLSVSSFLRTGGAIGFLGAYTTFSTLMYESFGRLDSGDATTAALNLAGSVALGFFAVYAGTVVGRTL